MKRQSERDTDCELRLRSALRRLGVGFRVDHRPLADFRRRADVVFVGARVAVFVDGCFWHGCEAHRPPSKTNTAWWAEKIARNRTRDADTDRKLIEAGWAVVRVWEHEDAEKAAERIAALVQERRQAAPTR